MNVLHIDAHVVQSSHTPGAPCGDVVLVERDHNATLVILADGLGHGSKAHVAATMYASRLMELLRRGRPLRSAFEAVVDTLEKARRRDYPFAAIVAARIRTDGEAHILAYEAPAPIVIGPRTSTLLTGDGNHEGLGAVFESYCVLEPKDGLLLTSDGINTGGDGQRPAVRLDERGVVHGALRMDSRGSRSGRPRRAAPTWRRGSCGETPRGTTAPLSS